MKKKNKDQLAEEAMKTVNLIVNSMAKKMNTPLSTDEIHSFALMGLARAIDKFDTKFNVAIGAYAAPWIRGAIIDEVNKTSPLPKSLRRQFEFHCNYENTLNVLPKQNAPLDKIDAAHKLSDKLKEVASSYLTSIATEEIVESPEPSPEESLENKRYLLKLKQVIKSLPDDQQSIIKDYYYTDLSFLEIGKQRGKSVSWVSRKVKTALKTIRLRFDLPPL